MQSRRLNRQPRRLPAGSEVRHGVAAGGGAGGDGGWWRRGQVGAGYGFSGYRGQAGAVSSGALLTSTSETEQPTLASAAPSVSDHIGLPTPVSPLPSRQGSKQTWCEEFYK